MKRLLLTLLCLILNIVWSPLASAEQRFVYLSAGGQVTVFQADPDSGKLTEIQANPGAGLTAITRDKKTLYRIGGQEVETYRIEKSGKLSSRGSEPTTAKAGYLGLDQTERFIAGNNYGEGSVAVWAIDDKGILRGEPVATMMLEKAAHSSVFSPGNGTLLVPATTPNKVFQLPFTIKAGALAFGESSSVSGPKGEGTAQQPRHLVFHPNRRVAYTTLERESPGVGVWKWSEEKGGLTLKQNLISTPEGYTGSATTADLHLTPNTRFLYVSNRDLTDRKALTGNSSIVGYRVDPAGGELTLVGHTPCPQVPRSFAIDQNGEFLYAAGQTAAKLEVFRINSETGALTSIEMIDTLKGPNWVQCVTLP